MLRERIKIYVDINKSLRKQSTTNVVVNKLLVLDIYNIVYATVRLTIAVTNSIQEN